MTSLPNAEIDMITFPPIPEKVVYFLFHNK